MVGVEFKEGDWFAVPLSDGGFAAGVIARANLVKKGLLGYFFGPRRQALPTLADVAHLRPSEAVLVRMFSHLGISEGRWPMLGNLPGWDRDEWLMPVFVRSEPLRGRTVQVFYDPDDPNKFLRERLIPRGEKVDGPKDGTMGSVYAERALSKLL